MANGIFANAPVKFLNKEIDYDTDAIKAMLATSSYVPNLDTHAYKSDVTNEVVGAGYTAGGATLGTKTVTVTAANSWATARANSTAYTLGQIVRPATGNGHLYICIVAGTSGGTVPTWPTVAGQVVTDGAVTWAECGRAIIVFDAADPSWPTSTITARYCIFYDDAPATDATKPLISLLDFGTDQVSAAGTFTVTLNPLGVFYALVP